jgi:pSer/pThr/pTyr-binding forkhead associated (FHA) protein
LDHTFAEAATLGRAPENSVALPQERLSAHHLRLSWIPESECYQLEDLGSSNGTRLDGARVHEPQRLGHLHLITLAERFHLVFQDLERCAARHGGDALSGPDPDSVERTLLEVLPLPLPEILQRAEEAEEGSEELSELTLFERIPLALPSFLRRREEAPRADRPAAESPPPESPFAKPPASGRLFLEVDEEGGTRRHPLPDGRYLLGRGVEATLQILSPEVSRTHAELTVAGGRIRLRDLGSSNHTFVDGRRIDGEVVVAPGQQLTFGSLRARLVIAEEGR